MSQQLLMIAGSAKPPRTPPPQFQSTCYLAIRVASGQEFRSYFELYDEAEDAKSFIDAWRSGFQYEPRFNLRIIIPDEDDLTTIIQTEIVASSEWAHW